MNYGVLTELEKLRKKKNGKEVSISGKVLTPVIEDTGYGVYDELLKLQAKARESREFSQDLRDRANELAKERATAQSGGVSPVNISLDDIGPYFTPVTSQVDSSRMDRLVANMSAPVKSTVQTSGMSVTDAMKNEDWTSVIIGGKQVSTVPTPEEKPLTAREKALYGGLYVGSTVASGVGNATSAVGSTLDATIGQLLKAFGWENNPVSNFSKELNREYEGFRASRDEAIDKLGWGKGAEVVGDLIEGTVAALPQALAALATGGSSLYSTASSLADDAVMASGNLLQKIGVTTSNVMKNPQFWMSYTQTYGNEYYDAIESGASEEAAVLTATAKSLINSGIEIGIDGGSGMQGLVDDIAKGGKKLLSWVESSIEEGMEEVVQGFISRLVDKFALGKDVKVLDPWTSAQEFGMGTAVGAILGGGQTLAVNSISNAEAKARENYLTETEKKVIDREVENRIKKAEKSGEKVTKNDIKNIEKSVKEEMEKGYLSTDTIEEVLGGDSYKAYQDTVKAEDDLIQQEKSLTEESKKLEAMVWEKMTGEQQVRRDELRGMLPEIRQKIEDMKKTSTREQLKTKLSEEVMNLAQGSRLMESYNEVGRHKQRLEVDLSQYKNPNARATAENLSKVFDNSNKAHDVLDLMTKIAEETGVTITDADAQAFEGTTIGIKRVKQFVADGSTTQYDIGSTNLNTEFKPIVKVDNQVVDNYTIDYKTGKITFETAPTGNVEVEFRKDARINAKVGGNQIVLDMKSKKYLESLVGHEVTHVLENLENKKLYEALQNSIFEYARSKGEYDSRLKKLQDLYNGIEGVDVNAELTAELVGDYLFQDSDFISKLSTENRNVFQKVYDEIKHLLKLATSGSDQARKLEQVKHKFDQVYRELGKAQKNTAENSGVQYSIAALDNGNVYVTASRNVVEGKTKAEQRKDITKFFSDLLDGKPSLDIHTIEGDVLTITKNETASKARDDYKTVNGQQVPMTDEEFTVKMHVEAHIDEVAEVSKNMNSATDNKNHSFAKDGFTYRRAYFEDFDGQYYEITLSVGHNGTIATVYNVGKIKGSVPPSAKLIAVVGSKPLGETLSDVDITQKKQKVNDQFSLSDSDGRELTPGVKKRFANSKAVDENGNLKVLYHGTASGEFTIFDKAKGSVEGDFGSGFYFTDNESDVSEHYEGGGPDFDNKVARLAERIEAEEDIDYEEAEKRAREELYKGSHKFEVYLNIENPAVVGETMLFDNESYLEQYNEEDYDDYDDYIADVEQALADDIENIVWEVEKNVDVYSTEGLSEVLYEAYNEGGIGIEELKSKINDLYLEDSDGNLVGNEVTRQIVESLGYDGIIDPTVSGKWNMDMEEGTTHYIVFKPNQIKAITNQNPTDNPDIHRSISEASEAPKKYGDRATLGSEITFVPEETVEDIAPVAENAALVAKNDTIAADAVEDLFPDDTAALQEEYEQLVAQRDDILSAMNIFAAVGDTENAEKMTADLEAVETRISEIEADESDRLSSISEADEPVTMDSAPEDVADNVPLTKSMVAELAKDVRSRLALPAKRVAEVRDLIARYSAEEFPSRAHLYEEIQERFGSYTESYVDEDLKGVKALLRTYGISVDENIKKDIADYGQLMRSNFGKVRFSKDGLPVDVAYIEFQEVMPGLFPESIDVPADQLLRIIEVANMDTTVAQEQNIDSDTLAEVTDLIANSVTQFKQTRKETLANKHGRESFQSLMEDADQYVPPVKPNTSAPTRVEMMASPDDIAPVFDTTSGQQALMPEPEPEAEAPKAITRKQLHENIVDDITTTFREKGYEFTDVLKNAKDLSTFATVDNTPQRVMEKALGYKEGQILADMTVNKVAQNETEGIRWLNSFTDKKDGLLAKISKQYGIKPGSKQSAAAQMYAEGFYVGENDAIIAYGDAELAADFPDAKVQQNIKKLARDPRIRMIYDETLAAINESRTRNAYPEIPRLDNYFLHFRAMEDTFSKMGLPFNPNDIRAKDLPTDLNGVTADLKPGQPYFASAMHRKGKRTSFDLLGGLEKYLTSAKNQIYHIDDIQTLRALRNYVAETYGQAHGLENLDTMSDEEAEQRIEEVYNSHLSTFAKFLNEEANVLAGKTSLIDRGLEGVIGRRGMTFLDTLNLQVGANMVGFNVSSSLTNFLAPVQAFAKTNKFDFVKAMAQTAANKIASIAGKGDNFAEESPVMIRRKGAERFYRTPWQKMSDPGYVMMSLVDDISTEIIARTKYNEFTRKGMDSQQAHIEADKWTSRLMGDRSLGQQPQVYNSKTLGLITKFQLEVRNQLDSQFYDTIQEAKVSTEEIENKLLRNAKKAAKITSTFVQLAVMQNLFGKAFESVAGYNPAFDIIDVLIKTFGWDDEEDDEDTVLDNVEQGFLELLGDLPYTSTLTGGRIPIASALPVTELIKGVDQYGNEKSRWDTIKEAAPYYFLPGGYGQIKKTKAGLDMFSEEHPVAGSYTDSGNLRFPVEDTLRNRVQAGLFGQWSSENARDYFDNDRKPMKENQIEEFLATGMEIQDYWNYREGLSEHDTLEEKVDYIAGLDLPIGTKNILVNNLTDRKDPIDLEGYENYSSFEEFEYAKKNPEKYALAKAVGGYDTYTVYVDALGDIETDKDKWGQSIKNSRTPKVYDYIYSLDIPEIEKHILFKSEYNSFDDHNIEIIEYLNNRDDISYDEMVAILLDLGFKVSADGMVRW